MNYYLKYVGEMIIKLLVAFLIIIEAFINSGCGSTNSKGYVYFDGMEVPLEEGMDLDSFVHSQKKLRTPSKLAYELSFISETELLDWVDSLLEKGLWTTSCRVDSNSASRSFKLYTSLQKRRLNFGLFEKEVYLALYYEPALVTYSSFDSYPRDSIYGYGGVFVFENMDSGFEIQVGMDCPSLYFFELRHRSYFSENGDSTFKREIESVIHPLRSSEFLELGVWGGDTVFIFAEFHERKNRIVDVALFTNSKGYLGHAKIGDTGYIELIVVEESFSGDILDIKSKIEDKLLSVLPADW